MRIVKIFAFSLIVIGVTSGATSVVAADQSQAVASASDQWVASLEPRYVKSAPRADAWGTPFRYVVAANRQSYRIISAGANRTFEPGSLSIDKMSQRATDVPGADIIWQNGQFVQYPRTADAYAKKTMADMRVLGTALEAYSIDALKYPEAEPRNDTAAPRPSTPAPQATTASQSTPPAATATSRWRTWTSPDGRFSIDLPDEPIAQVEEKPKNYYNIRIGNRLFAAYVTDEVGDVAAKVASEAWIRELVSRLVSSQAQLIETHISTAGGFPARYGTIDMVSSDVNVRLQVAGFAPKPNVFVMLSITVGKSQFESEKGEMSRFFSSLRMLPAATQTAAAPAVVAQPAPAGAIAGWRTWTAPNGRFSIDLPDEPIKSVNENPAGFCTIVIGNRSVVVVIKDGSGDFSNSAVSDEWVRGVVSGLAAKQGQLVETHVSTVGDSAARYATIDFVASDINFRAQYAAYAPKPGTFVMASYTTMRSQFESHQNEIARVLSSLRVNQTAAAPAAAATGSSNSPSTPAPAPRQTPGSPAPNGSDPQTANGGHEKGAVLHTSAGDIVIRFFPDVAPNHVRNFIELATRGFYDGVKFHRVIPGFMIQTGDPNTISGPPSTWGTGGSGKTLKAEFNSIPHTRGIVSMARNQSPDSATSQFFIVVKESHSLDGRYTVFGQVASGMDVADRIANAPRGQNDRPNDPVTIKSITFRELTAEEQAH